MDNMNDETSYYYEYIHYLRVLYSIYSVYKEYTQKQKRNYKKKRMWVRKIYQNRKAQGDFFNLVQELRLHDTEMHFNYFRMNREMFDVLEEAIHSKIEKTFYSREPVSPAEKLSATLRYLASGDSMISISYAYRLGKTTISNIIQETCAAIWEALNDKYLSHPDSNLFSSVAMRFESEWQLPNCVGALDGKHVIIQAPPHSGSDFYNYKNSHSIVLLALCDADYKFTVVDIGAQGKQSDGGILRNSEFGKRLYSNSLDFPAPQPIEYAGEELPMYIVGDEAFPLKPNLMRPFPGRFLSQDKRIFNYRLSRGRRVIENTFGILVSRWRIFRKPIIASLKTTENIIKATVCLHNFIMANKNQNPNYCPLNYVDTEDSDGNIIQGEWRSENAENLLQVQRSSSNFFSADAAAVRNSLTSYFLTEGAVPFQWGK